MFPHFLQGLILLGANTEDFTPEPNVNLEVYLYKSVTLLRNFLKGAVGLGATN